MDIASIGIDLGKTTFHLDEERRRRKNSPTACRKTWTLKCVLVTEGFKRTDTRGSSSRARRAILH